MGKINEKLGTNYQLFNYYGAPDADRVIIAMGSINDVAEEVIDYMNAHGEKSAWSRFACTVRSVQTSWLRLSRLPPRRSQSSTARRSPALWANLCTWTL